MFEVVSSVWGAQVDNATYLWPISYRWLPICVPYQRTLITVISIYSCSYLFITLKDAWGLRGDSYYGYIFFTRVHWKTLNTRPLRKDIDKMTLLPFTESIKY